MPPGTPLPPSGDCEREVRALADGILAEGGEEPLPAGAVPVDPGWHDGLTPLSAALQLVGQVRSGRAAAVPSFARPPYDRQEARAAEYIVRKSAAGGGMDPVGFLIASHSYAMDLLALHRERVAMLERQIRALGEIPVLPDLTPGEAAALERAVAAHTCAIRATFGVEPRRVERWSDGERLVELQVTVAPDLDAREIRKMEARVRSSVESLPGELAAEIPLRCLHADAGRWQRVSLLADGRKPSMTADAPACGLETAIIGLLRDHCGDAAHDTGHLQRVVRMARHIAVSEGPHDTAVLVAAAWLHDCVAVPKDSPHRAMASRMAASAAFGMLREIGFPSGRLVAVAHAIEAHSFSAGIAPETAEARALQDADRLDGLGAIGIARTFAVSGALGRPLFDPADPLAEHREPDDAAWGLDHLLLRLQSTMQTAEGRRIAALRAGAVRGFMCRIADENSGADAIP